eukprot:5922128-Pleurochrysis_carterae.AAC.1
MQERELRKGSVERCGVEGHRSHWPSTTGADPAALSGVPPATAPDCKPMRGSNTGVGVSTGGDGLSALLPSVAFAGGLPPEANAVRARGAAQAPEVTRARTVAVCCARHTRPPWRGSGVHGRGGGGRAAAVHARRVGCGKHQYGAPLRPWRYESLRVSAVRASRLCIRERMN